ncbi:glycosyltransferase family 2 protein [Cyanobium sp. NIES-981]|uniref:glycosyltransferase family 2 protein n=1 Tax=Cyanobium sp. NIES-981 TaxID=1851505 RepID=UPI0007DD1CA2|nr:glycosyltransferase family 2 protein [Cyanobium sp. NIES-981]SBO44564.1 Glycosyl transferase, group 2 family protein [Cyanobium sp. NIES-981]
MSDPGGSQAAFRNPDLVWLPPASRRLIGAARLMEAGRPVQALHQLMRVASGSTALRPFCSLRARQALHALQRDTRAPWLSNPRPPHASPEGLLAWVVAHPARLVELTEATPEMLRLGLLYQQVWDASVWLTTNAAGHALHQGAELHCLDGHRLQRPDRPPAALNPRQAPQARLERAIRLTLGRRCLQAWHPWPWLPRRLGPEVGAPLPLPDLPRHWLEARRTTHALLLEESSRIDWVEEGKRSRRPELVSVVIPVWGAGGELAACLACLRGIQTGVPLEILLVDNGNTDPGTRAVLAEAPLHDPRLRVLPQPRNFGFALGCNLGFAASQGTRVLFLNSDARLEADALEPLLERLEDPHCRAVQPALITPTGAVQCLGIVFGGASRLGLALHAGLGPDPALLHGREVPAVTAACVLVRAEEFAAVQGFDVGYLNGQEDTDLCLRLRQRFGGCCAVAAASRAIHPEGSSPGRYRFIEANRSRLLARWPRTDSGSLERALADDGLTLVGYLPNDRPDRPAWLRSPRPVVSPGGTDPAAGPVR